MKRFIWVATLLMLYAGSMHSQYFAFRSESPFGIQPILADTSNQALRILFSDIDGDDDYDVIMAGLSSIEFVDPLTWDNIHYFIEIQENTGDKWNPVFGERRPLSADFPFPAGYFIPSSGDVNSDGQTDFLTYGIVDLMGNKTMVYHRSTSGSPLDFDPVRLDMMGLMDFVPGSTFIPLLVDLDKDGDLDILASGADPPYSNLEIEPYPVFYYAKNVGSPSQPEFKGWFANPYGLFSHPLVELVTGAGDIDKDGDVDLVGTMSGIPADSNNYFYVHINTPANAKPAFTSPLLSPYGLPVGHGDRQYLFPELVDIDGDTDLDLFVFRVENNEFHFEYFENTLVSASHDSGHSHSVSLYPNPTDGMLYIVNESLFVIDKITITNISGKEVRSGRIDGNMQVNLSTLPKGAYMVRMTGRGIDVVKKIVRM